MPSLSDLNYSLSRRLDLGRHPFAYNLSFPPGLPLTGKASELFNEITEKVRRYTGDDCPEITKAQVMTMRALFRASEFEMGREAELTKLAKALIYTEFGTSEESVRIELKFGSGMTFDGMRTGATEDHPLLQDEIQKRRVINGLIQGAARKGQYLFHMADRELNQIDPDLLTLYGEIMSLNEYLYWIMPDELILISGHEALISDDSPLEAFGLLSGKAIPEEQLQKILDLSSQRAGRVKLDFSGEIPTIHAEAVCFPVMLHELYKGMVELVCSHGLPKDPKVREEVCEAADRFEYEFWDLRVGPIFWRAFSESVIKLDQRFHELEKLVTRPPKDFHAAMRNILRR